MVQWCKNSIAFKSYKSYLFGFAWFGFVFKAFAQTAILAKQIGGKKEREKKQQTQIWNDD